MLTIDCKVLSALFILSNYISLEDNVPLFSIFFSEFKSFINLTIDVFAIYYTFNVSVVDLESKKRFLYSKKVFKSSTDDASP